MQKFVSLYLYIELDVCCCRFRVYDVDSQFHNVDAKVHFLYH